MPTGRIKWFSDAKGYGFIETPEGDVFVHYSAIEMEGYKSLSEGQQVQFEVVQGPKGLQASKVIVKDTESAATAMDGSGASAKEGESASAVLE